MIVMSPLQMSTNVAVETEVAITLVTTQLGAIIACATMATL